MVVVVAMAGECVFGTSRLPVQPISHMAHVFSKIELTKVQFWHIHVLGRAASAAARSAASA